VLSRLISLLSRIPAVKWAVNRLRPLPHSGSIEVTPSAVDEPPIITEIAEAAPTVETIASDASFAETSAEAGPAAVEEPAELLANVEPEIVEVSSAPSIEAEAIDAPEAAASGGLPVEVVANAEVEIVEEAPLASTEVEAIEPQEAVSGIDPSSDDGAEVAPDVAEQALVSPVEVEIVPVEAAEPVVEDEPACAASMEIEAVAASDPGPVAADVAEDMVADAPVVAAVVEPPQAPAPKKPRAKVVEPTDRAALIRQRWAETGIRMWNPRLHGTGDAALNIQGRIGLLPPEPGETMPRYDKLEFKMLGGQIVCEGVIVEAPVHAGQRSFTRLAEPRGPDRPREPVRERQAALA